MKLDYAKHEPRPKLWLGALAAFPICWIGALGFYLMLSFSGPDVAGFSWKIAFRFVLLGSGVGAIAFAIAALVLLIIARRD